MAAIIITNKQKEFQAVETGLYDAICIKQVDLGTQKSEFKGVKSQKRKVRLVWELPTTLMEDNKPFIISKYYTMCLYGDSSLKKDLQNWRGRAFTKDEINRFDLSKVLGVPCKLMVSNEIGDNDKKFTKITAISPNPKFSVEKLHNEILSFSLDNFEREIFEKLSDYEKKIIMESPEYQNIVSNKLEAVAENTLQEIAVEEEELDEEEIPF